MDYQTQANLKFLQVVINYNIMNVNDVVARKDEKVGNNVKKCDL